MLVFRLEVDRTILREVTCAARSTLQSNGHDRNGWGNALEKTAEELKAAPYADVHVDEAGNILGLLYGPHERIGVTYYVRAEQCQCEAYATSADEHDLTSPPQRRPCRHRGNLRLIGGRK